MNEPLLATDRLDLGPLPAAAAAALPRDRPAAAAIIGASLPDAWPQPDLLEVLPMQAATDPGLERFGIWVMIERDVNEVVGDLGFLGPPADGSVEIGFSVVPDQRRRGFAREAARALVAWVLDEPEVDAVVARSEAANDASAGVLAAAGFARVGERDGIVSWRRTARR